MLTVNYVMRSPIDPCEVFSWRYVGIDDVLDAVNGLSSSKSLDFHGFSNMFLKRIIIFLVPPLTH